MTDPSIYDVPAQKDLDEAAQDYQREMDKKKSARDAALLLLPLFLDGYFENCGDDMAQDAADAGGDACDIIENWLRGVAGVYLAEGK